jgi:hypothetical protein
LPLPLLSLLLLTSTPADVLLAASPDFQTKLGYALPAAGGANLSTASKANAQKYNTLSLVLEQPFKDCIGEACKLISWMHLVVFVTWHMPSGFRNTGAGAALEGHHR